ncbi:MAG: hypothetical protein JO019_03300 [Candidatus Kaiserbacteria bacterium]|nr:hypothetical protein [Candidatus Kaiserbacteria bacterium]
MGKKDHALSDKALEYVYARLMYNMMRLGTGIDPEVGHEIAREILRTNIEMSANLRAHLDFARVAGDRLARGELPGPKRFKAAAIRLDRLRDFQAATIIHSCMQMWLAATPLKKHDARRIVRNAREIARADLTRKIG